MEIAIVVAAGILAWFAWQLFRAKQFNAFKVYLRQEVKPKLITAIEAELVATQNEFTPNNDSHRSATVYFWTQHSVRILQKALALDILSETQLKANKKWRFCQHLFFIEKQYLVKLQEKDNH